jgi:hypothetical protein
MTNCFLLNEAVGVDDLNEFKEGMSLLLTIEKETDDKFLKHESVWNLAIFNQLFQSLGQQEQSIIKFIEQLKGTEIYIDCREIFDLTYPEMHNSFLGINFEKTGIPKTVQIINDCSFKEFKDRSLWSVSYKDFWGKREKLFPSLTLCGEVEGQIFNLGTSSEFSQIVSKLREFDRAVKGWTNGKFNYQEINRNFSLNMSPESDTTMRKFKGERMFSLPSGEIVCFELHIKTGNLRFHFYPDNGARKVYVGYIGPHLRI